MMLYGGFVLVIFFLHLLLKMNWIATAVLFFLLLILLPLHIRKYREKIRQSRRFSDVCLYCDTVLYAFARSHKIDVAVEETAQALPDGELKNLVKKAVDHMKLTFDDSDVIADSLGMIEESYRCRRLINIHRFMTHAEYYGGEIRHSVDLFLKDKANWEKRVREAMAARKKQWTEIVFSVLASLIICGMVMYFPVMNVDISTQPLTQIVSVVVVLLDDLIMQKGQKYLSPDWLTIEEDRDDVYYEKKMQSFRNYDPAKDRRLSVILGSIAALGMIACFGWVNQWAGFILALFALILFNQHRWGRAMAKRSIEKGIITAFPAWLTDLVLLLQSENVQVALQKSRASVPGILREELERLLDRLEMNPEAAEPYHRFLCDFHLPQITSVMSMLYTLSAGNGRDGERQVEELISRNQDMMDTAAKIRMSNSNGGMYGWFLAPVLTASLKLLVDMGLFMLSFLRAAAV